MKKNTNFYQKKFKFNNCMKTVIAIMFVSLTSNFNLQAQCPVWADEFNVDGAPNPANWGYDIGNGQNGWGNGEAQYYTNRSQNASVQVGTLKITTIKEAFSGFNYTSARLLTQGKFKFKYGRVDVRAKLPTGGGIWPAIWSLGDNINSVDWPACGEMDIMEYKGNEPNKIYGTLHYPERFGGGADGNSITINNAATEFHIYSLDWTPTAVKIYVDNVLFHTVPNSNAIPFNHDFFLILNVAVGGTFGGAIDPAFNGGTMEIDYIRVFNNYSISGDTFANPAQVKSYAIQSIPGVTYNWTVPAGAIITSGNGTNAINVNWGTTSGNVSLTTTVTAGCSVVNPTKVYSLPVIVVAQGGDIYEDYEQIHTISYNTATGTYASNTANPSTSGTNTSANVGKYDRNSGQLYDNISFVTNIANAVEFISGSRKFAMDVYTSAPVGTQINWQLENNTKANEAYPSGRHSYYTATVQQTNTWHTLVFTYNSSPDTGTLDSEVNRFVLLFNPNSNTNNTFYFDNLRSVSTNLDTQSFDLDIENDIKIYPNPSNQFLKISLPNNSQNSKIKLSNLLGKVVFEKNLEANLQDYIIDMTNLSSGVYLLQLKSDKKIWTKKVIKQ